MQPGSSRPRPLTAARACTHRRLASSSARTGSSSSSTTSSRARLGLAERLRRPGARAASPPGGISPRPRRGGGRRDGRHRVSGLAGGRAALVSHVASGADPRSSCTAGQLRAAHPGLDLAELPEASSRRRRSASRAARGDFVAATLFELLEPGAAPPLALRREPSGRIALTRVGAAATGPRRRGPSPSTSRRGFSRSWRTAAAGLMEELDYHTDIH